MTDSEPVVHAAMGAKASATRMPSFERADAMIGAIGASQASSGPSRVERGTLIVGLLGAAASVLFGSFVGGTMGQWLAIAGVVIEVIGLGISSVLTLKRHWLPLRQAKRHFARGLDMDFDQYRHCVAELRQSPRAELEARLRYIRGRASAMQHGLGLFTGGIERLGILPVLGVLYLQFRDWRWGDWERLVEVNLIQGMLIYALLLVYVTGWYLAGLYRRVQTYELLYAEAAHPDEWTATAASPAVLGSQARD